MVGIQREKIFPGKAGLVGDARLEGVRQVVLRRGWIVEIRLAAADVHVGCEGAVGPGLPVLRMLPPDLVVAVAAVVGLPFFTHNVDGIKKIEVATILVSFPVPGAWLDGPAASRIDVAHQLQVDIIVDGPVVAPVLEIEAPVGRLAPGRQQDARMLALTDGEKAKGQEEGRGHILDDQVGRAGHDTLVGDHLRLEVPEFIIPVLAVGACGI